MSGRWTREAQSTVVNDANANSFAALCVASNGDLVLAYRVGTDHSSSDGEIVVQISDDDGATWGAASTVLSDGSWDYRDTSLVTLADGTVMLTCGRRTSGGVGVTDGIVVLKSSDHGGTWGSEIAVTGTFTALNRGAGEVHELSGGTLLLPYYGRDTGDSFHSAALMESTDGGDTWSAGATIVDGESLSRNYNEVGLVEQSGGDLLAVIRGEGADVDTDPDWHTATSDDDGETWGALSLAIDGASGWPKIAKDPDGRLLAVVRMQGATGSPNRVAVSEDDGATWTVDVYLATGSVGQGAYGEIVTTGGAVYAAHSYEPNANDGDIFFATISHEAGPMSIRLGDRIRETTTTTGTGTVDLGGAATGLRGFVAGIADGAEVPYCIEGRDGTDAEGEWEVGTGTITDAATDTLSRDTVLSSSNGDAAVNFSAGTKDVFLTLPAARTIAVLGVDSPSSVATVDMDLPAGFSIFEITGWMSPATDNVLPRLRFDDGGGFDDTDEYDYAAHRLDLSESGGGEESGSAAGVGHVALSPIQVGSDTNEFISFKITLHRAKDAAFTYALVEFLMHNPTTGREGGYIRGSHNVAASLDAFRLLFSSGNVADGEVRLIGIP